MTKTTTKSHAVPTAIIAGEGDLPQTVIEACLASGQPLFVIALDHNTTQPSSLHKVPHAIINIASVGQAIRTLQKHHVKTICFAGYVKRPKWSSLRPDVMGLKLIKRLRGNTAQQGDNGLLSSILNFFEEHGFEAVGVERVVPELLVSQGALGSHTPAPEAQKDIRLGQQVLAAIGELDIGQSVIVQQGVVLGIEAAEGTDALIARCHSLHQEGAGGILVKCKKQNQDPRIDLPTIGQKTLEYASQFGLQGIAVQAETTLLVNPAQVRQYADAHHLFVIGC